MSDTLYPPLTLAVVSGKGGVGKSVIATHLAETFAADGFTVGLLDADLGQSACPILLNEAPAATLDDVLAGAHALPDTLHATVEGVTLVQGARGPAPVPPPAQFDVLDAAFELLRDTHEVVVIDAPAGAGPLVRWALDRAGLGLVVLVGEPTAVADAYALVKLAWTSDPAFPLGLVVNYADTETEAEQVAVRFGAVTEPFLGQRPAYLGWVPYTVAIRQAVVRQAPAVRAAGSAQQAFAHLADAVAGFGLDAGRAHAERA